jgi:hypothetical protein
MFTRAAVSLLGRPGPLALALLGPAALAGASYVAPQDGDAAPGAARGVRAGALVELPLDQPASGLVALDLDGDGADELVLCHSQPGRLLVLRGLRPELGAPVERKVLHGPGWCVGPIRIAGEEPRLALASRETCELLLLDAGCLLRDAPPLRVPLPGVPACLASGDAGADGYPDVCVLTEDGTLVLVSGDGGARRADLGGALPTCALVASDGRELLVGFQSDLTVRAFALEPGGRFARETRRFALDGIPRGLVELDADGDGELERFAVGGDDSIWRLAGEAPEPRTAGKVPIAVEVADLDGDGGAEGLVLYLYDEAFGALGSPEERRPAGGLPWAMTAGDLDGDGCTDLAFASNEVAGVALRFGPAAADAAARVAVADYPHALALGDLDGDARPDAVVLGALESSLSVLRNTGGALVRELDLDVGPGAAEVRCGDVDGDGAVDVVVLVEDFAAARLLVLRGDGRGGLEPPAAPLRVGRAGADLVVADLDGDGAAECIVADPEAGALHVVARGAVRSLALAGGPRALAALRRADGTATHLAVGLSAGGAVVALELGPGGVRLGARTAIATPGAVVAAVAADLDGEGRDDGAFLCPGASDTDDGVLVPFQRDAGGAWAAGAPLPGAGSKAMRLASADLDGDDREDLLAAAQFSHGVACWMADEGGELRRTYRIGAGRGCMDVACADVDGDGLPEVIVVNSYSDDVSVIPVLPGDR